MKRTGMNVWRKGGQLIIVVLNLQDLPSLKNPPNLPRLLSHQSPRNQPNPPSLSNLKNLLNMFIFHQSLCSVMWMLPSSCHSPECLQ